MVSIFDYPVFGVALLVASLALAVAVLGWAGVSGSRAREAVQERFVWGVPWGSLVVVGWLLFVFYVLQDGWDGRPVVVAFMAFSLFEPSGWLLGGFAHSSVSHLRGNLTTTLVFAPIVEYAWGHYPPEDRRKYEPSWARMPVVRAFVLFPIGIGALGILITLFSWGPVIGFSIVAFALIGCALIHYPIIALLGLVIRAGLRVGLRSIRDPITITEASVRVVRPSWYGVAVQGHLLGLLVGVLIGIALLQYRRRSPDPARTWISALLLGLYLSIWAIWWVLGPEEFVLFRAVGVAIVVMVATIVTLGAMWRSPGPLRIPEIGPKAAVLIILLAVMSMGVVGVGLNLTVAESPVGEPAVTIDGYDVYYGENVPDGMLGVVDTEILGIDTAVTTSGVIVVNEDRHIWYRAVPARNLETHGVQRFEIGGIGWSESVFAVRRGWAPVGNESVYHIRVGQPGELSPAFASEESRAQPVIDGHQFTLDTEDGVFLLRVERNNETASVDIPETNESVQILDVEISRAEGELIATSDDTRVAIAHEEEYE